MLVELLLRSFLKLLNLVCPEVDIVGFNASGNSLDVDWWILHVKLGIQLEVDKSEEMYVKLLESSDNFVVEVKRQLLVELVGSNPSDVLSHNFNLVVNSLD